MSSSGTMSSSEELADQESSTGASAFDQGEGTPGRGRGGFGLSVRLALTCLGNTDHLPPTPTR